MNDNKNKQSSQAQYKRVLRHLMNGGRIDITKTGCAQFGYCTRLAARIRDIKDNHPGIIINSKFIKRVNARVKEYWIEPEYLAEIRGKVIITK